ncbi:MAG: adenylate/guanylate cyclase domain-containing protein [Anaerolineales bacterium]
MRAKAIDLPRRLIAAIRFPSDSKIDVLKKLVVLLGNLGGFFFSFVLALLYSYYHLTIPTILAGVYLVAVALVYVYYFRTKQLDKVAFLFSLLLFVELVTQHIALGGFKSSGVVFIWVAACAIVVMITGQSRLAVLWIVLFLVATGIFVYFEPVIAAANPRVPDQLSNLLFALNFGFGLTYMISNTFIFMYLLEVAQKQADDLLLNILPASVATRLKEGERTIADSFKYASIMFVDIVNFTPISAASTAKEMVVLLSELFSRFDELVEKHNAEKIETIGDSYMVAVGLPVPRSDHAEIIASLALDIQAYLAKGISISGKAINCRIGINSGPLMAGVIGHKRISYNVWGDTVNTASRMESHGIPGQIQISDTTYELIRNNFICEPRGIIDVKGKGSMKTYLLRRRVSEPANDGFVREHIKDG